MMQNRKPEKIQYYTKIDQIDGLPTSEKGRAADVAQVYRFRSNHYYLSLIDWNDPEDPIRRLIIPDSGELETWGHFDPSGEVNFTVMPGVEHKYPSTVLLLVSNVCGGICRYCFRKRVFISAQGEVLKDLPAAAEYIRNHPEITNVLLTGGDPLMLSTKKLSAILEALLPIEHVKIIRIGTKMPAFNPYRILRDQPLLDRLADCERHGKKIYIMTHFNHPRELTAPALECTEHLRRTGANLNNQTPIIRGINDDPDVLADLFRTLSFNGITPYYVFQCRPASGNKHLAVPLETGYHIFEQARSQVSGLAKQARFVMSHISGKIEIVGVKGDWVYMKYHRSAEEQLSSEFLILKRNPQAYWFDDYEPVSGVRTEEILYRAYGPE